MSKPFRPGTKVYHKTGRKYGVVESCWNLLDRQRGETWMYYVRHSGHVWSIPHQALATKNSPEH